MIAVRLAERISHQLAQDALVAKTVLLDSLDSQRYFRILDAIDAFLADPRLSKSAAGTATEVLPRLINHRIRALLAAIRSALETTDPPRHDHALHEVRKTAKAVRDGAELLLAVRPKRTRRLVQATTQLRDSLGGQHDRVLARHSLKRLAATAFLSGEDTFTYGRLYRAEQDFGEDAESRYEKLIRRIPKSLRQA
ncbi:MAG: CHAD domain-containing protein [Microbacteriaceae bacterium]|nr:CHAD domain-containing protein [Microbacteriaceae bacterium]